MIKKYFYYIDILRIFGFYYLFYSFHHKGKVFRLHDFLFKCIL